MDITKQILADHAARKDADGISWFDAGDLKRLGIQERLFTVMQTGQQSLCHQSAHQLMESHGCTDRWSLEDTH